MASPASSGAMRVRGTAWLFAISSRSCTSSAHAPPASSTSARNTRWSPATAPVCAAAAAAPAVDSPAFSTATPTPRSAHSASASHISAPSPSASRYSAIERTASSRASAAIHSAGSTATELPHEITVWKRMPRLRRQCVHGHVAALRHERHGPRLEGAQRVAPHRRARVQRHDPVPVRAADRKRMARRRLAQPELVIHAERDLAEARAIHHRATAAERAGLLHDLRHASGGDAHHHRVGWLGQLGERREARKAVRLGAVRIDAPDRSGKARRAQVQERLARVRVVALACAYHRDAARPQQPGEVHQCSVRSTPRRSRARAMISRWISLVPSQMRSTRSSRKKRSATLVRM